ncbi:MAG: hypothetical protein VX733_02005 [Candidatus Latescibacterota bacterium]|nr:hypothetical protein [Candidatus Latescibacterota bacterium]
MQKAVPQEYRDHLSDRQVWSLSGGSCTGVTLRGFWTGAFLSFFLAVGAPYSSMVMHGTFMSWDFNTPGAIFLFIVLALLIFIGITRIVSEAGLAAVRAPMIAPDLTIMGLGSGRGGSSISLSPISGAPTFACSSWLCVPMA